MLCGPDGLLSGSCTLRGGAPARPTRSGRHRDGQGAGRGGARGGDGQGAGRGGRRRGPDFGLNQEVGWVELGLGEGWPNPWLRGVTGSSLGS